MSSFLPPRIYATPPLSDKIPVAIVGATGMVGRRFAELLAEHPYFEVKALTASARSEGRIYTDIALERGYRVPKNLAYMRIGNIVDLARSHIRLVFSAFDGTRQEILDTESGLAERGFVVVSNNSVHRWTPDVPMMLPEVNPEHLTLLETQASYKENGGGIIVKPNCSIQSYVPVIKAWEKFGVRRIFVVTEQSISGAGKTFAEWPEMEDNVIPHIDGEEEKSEQEPRKVLGDIRDGILSLVDLPISALCTRVATTDGHMANVFVEFEQSPTEAELKAVLEYYNNPIEGYGLPSSPEKFMIYTDDPNRPQTRLDRDTGNGMSLTVGRLQKKGESTWSFNALSHNTLRGAAGGAVLTAELLQARGYLR